MLKRNPPLPPPAPPLAPTLHLVLQSELLQLLLNLQESVSPPSPLPRRLPPPPQQYPDVCLLGFSVSAATVVETVNLIWVIIIYLCRLYERKTFFFFAIIKSIKVMVLKNMDNTSNKNHKNNNHKLFAIQIAFTVKLITWTTTRVDQNRFSYCFHYEKIAFNKILYNSIDTYIVKKTQEKHFF